MSPGATTIDLVKDLDMEKGELLFGTPSEGGFRLYTLYFTCDSIIYACYTGAEFTFWCGGYARDDVGLLVCCALNCYHAITTYKWIRNGTPVIGNPYSVLYVNTSGKYECVMETEQGDLKTQEFDVIGTTYKPHP